MSRNNWDYVSRHTACISVYFCNTMQILPGPMLPEQVCQVLDLAPSWVEISFSSKTHGGSKDLASSNNRWYGVKASRSPRWIFFYIKPLATALPHGHCLLTLECEMLLYFYNKYQDNQHVRRLGQGLWWWFDVKKFCGLCGHLLGWWNTLKLNMACKFLPANGGNLAGLFYTASVLMACCWFMSKRDLKK